MSEVKKPEKIKHHPYCRASKAKHTRCICDRKEYMRLNEHWEAYHEQELAKEKAKRVELESETTGLNLAHIIYNSIENQVPEYKDLVRTIQDYLVGNQLPEKVMEYIVKEELKDEK